MDGFHERGVDYTLTAGRNKTWKKNTCRVNPT